MQSDAFKARLEYELNKNNRYSYLGRPSKVPPVGEQLSDYACKYGVSYQEIIDVLPEVEDYLKVKSFDGVTYAGEEFIVDWVKGNMC